MIPRTELVAVEADASLDVLLDLINRSGFARLPVYGQNVDNMIGILHVTDLVKAIATGSRAVTAESLAREALTVPVTLRADDLLAAMRRRGVREALVIDEYGGTAGLVTFDSLTERIVGDLGTGTAGGGRIVLQPDGSAEIDGLTLVTDANQQFDLGIDEHVYTTMGGYVLGRIGRRARLGDIVEVAGRQIRVLSMDKLRVAKIWLSKPLKSQVSSEER
jgi:putative hemolysin